ncbi:hypothetical protein F2Q70_00040301 [Brassica cretica]|uniref:Protein kinase domain-containing protein n=1 Tax=Brassica cretica TaxID=69181 RepID=A0A8S9K5P1_BRACR|nr:hypothetical protein F2Q70_00040301 [Brassica cretica]
MFKSLETRFHHLFRLHPILVFIVCISFGITVLILLSSVYENNFRSAVTYKKNDFDNDVYPFANLKNLVMKHPGQAATFSSPKEKGVEAAEKDDESLLLFSGGEARKEAGPRSEAQSYWAVAESKRWFGKDDVRSRALTEEHARDSFENLLFRTTIGFLSILLVVSCVQQRMKHRKIAELRQKFFEQNGGGMLIQRLSGPGTPNANVKIFTKESMKTSTNGYDKSRILGQGGQGTVYKGILPDNSIVAVKKARLGDNSQVEQFINEVLVLSQINHRNVVKLLGCCLETEVPLLVYEFINSGTFFDHLHGSLFGPSLTWEQRLRIAVEIAGTLAYLHSSASIPIIHRDVNTANILLDENLTAKVADFGASRLIPMDKEQLATMVQGTLGYLDPEYYTTGLLNEKSDVYSFGVVLMELLTGQKALCFERPQESKHLVNYIASATKENRLHENDRRGKATKMKEVAAKLEGLRVTKTKHQWSDQYPGEETKNLAGVGILSEQGDKSSTGYDSINNVASMHIEAGR